MQSLRNTFNTLKTLPGKTKRQYYSLPALEEQGIGPISRLPISIRIILESLVRNCDGKRVKEEDVKNLANWNAKKPSDQDVPFVVTRVVLQDFTGVPLLVDLAAMRDAASVKGAAPEHIEPKVPVDLVVDHSVQVDASGSDSAFMFNLKVEFDRNKERYEFLKWGQEAFETFKVVPPGIGIVHQVNLEHLASVVTPLDENGSTLLFPDTLVGTDSHTTMINGIGVVGWGVGGIEAEAAMLGQSVSLQTPEVVGVYLKGQLREGVTATDLTLRVTELLRKEKVVGKFVEFFGEGAASLTVADRATIGNMAPEYGATMGYFPADDKTLDYLRMTGRSEESIETVKQYLIAQKLYGMPKKGEIIYSKELELDLSTLQPCVAGPKRPQDRIDLQNLKSEFNRLLSAAVASGGYEKNDKPRICIKAGSYYPLKTGTDSGGIAQAPEKAQSWGEEEMVSNRPFTHPNGDPNYANVSEITTDDSVCDIILSHGSVAIAAITSCTNTSNPAVMIAAGLLAKKAVEKGLKVNSMVKTSLAPGSRVVTDYLERLDLQKYLDTLGFQLVAYGCTTCIGNSGPLEQCIEDAIKEHDIVAASVLSGNRNFEARIHSAIKANFLMSPPLVVAFALAGRVDIDMQKEPLGYGKDGKPVYLRDVWPSGKEIQDAIQKGLKPEMFKKRYAHVLDDNPVWKTVTVRKEAKYSWDAKSTYIQKPPYFDKFENKPEPLEEINEMRVLAIFGDSVTTDHISPAGAFSASSPAGKYLLSLGIKESDFNSYGSRRGNHHVMKRGTFANVRIRNKMADGKEGGYTKLMPDGKLMTIFDACQEYEKQKVPLIVFAGRDYGMGSSRDWAAKGPMLLGIKVVVATSFERIHRSNLIGMGILPLEFKDDQDAEKLGITGEEICSLNGLKNLQPRQEINLVVNRKGKKEQVPMIVRLDTPIEVEYYMHGGILPYVLRKILSRR